MVERDCSFFCNDWNFYKEKDLFNKKDMNMWIHYATHLQKAISELRSDSASRRAGHRRPRCAHLSLLLTPPLQEPFTFCAKVCSDSGFGSKPSSESSCSENCIPPISLHILKVWSCFLKVVLSSLIKILKSLGFSPRRIRKSYYIMKLTISPFGPVHCFSWTQHLHSQALKICC